MNKRRNLLFIFMGLIGLMALYGCAENRQALGVPVVPEGTKPPVITAYFAPTEGVYGFPMRVYLAAEDPDGDMLRIAVLISQVGYGYYPTDWIFLKPGFEKKFVGYLQWNTLSTHTPYMPEWMRVTIRVAVLDKYGVESNEVIFPYEFMLGGKPSPPPPPPFNSGSVPRLGYINVNLFNPFDMGNGNDFFRR
jgi:hypothetical protein